jgi:hypothetical protein
MVLPAHLLTSHASRLDIDPTAQYKGPSAVACFQHAGHVHYKSTDPNTCSPVRGDCVGQQAFIMASTAPSAQPTSTYQYGMMIPISCSNTCDYLDQGP